MGRPDVDRLTGIGLDFLTQPENRLIDRSCRHIRIDMTPAFAEQLIA
jgi:hypothetical protein